MIRRRLYVPAAHPADRFFALNCGCVFIVPQCDALLDGGYDGALPSEQRHDCGKGWNLIDEWITAVYYYDLTPDGRGHRWQ